MALTKVTYSMIENGAVDVKNYGASSSASAVDNLAAFKLAVAATPEGGILYIPADAAEYVIDTNGGESDAIEIDKRMTVWVDGTIKSNFGATQVNPPTIFLVTADSVTFSGNGIIEGDGATNQDNSGTDETFPSLIKVTGNYFSMTGLTIKKPYKIGLFLSSSTNSIISGNKFTGGPTAYEDTAYFGVRVYLGGQHIFSNNQFYPDDDGGMLVQCMFTSGANNCIFEGNIAYHPYEKLVYINGNDNLVSDNIVIGNTDFVPGTGVKGTLTTVYRSNGSRNKITNNYSRYGGGATCLDGTANEISNNTFFDAGQSGITLFVSSGTPLFDYTTIRGNVITCGNLTGVIIQDGILVNCPTGTNRFIDISDNTVKGFALANNTVNLETWSATKTINKLTVINPTVPIANRTFRVQTTGITGGTEPVWNTTPGGTTSDGSVVWETLAISSAQLAQIRVLAPLTQNDKCVISNNILDGGQLGIYTNYMTNSTISNNRINATVAGINQNNGTRNTYRFNTVEGTSNIEILNFDVNSQGEGNSYSGSGLIVTTTLPAAVNTVTISSTTIQAAPNGRVLLTPVNASAAALVASAGIYASVSSPNIVLTSGTGANFAGTEQFNVQIIQ